MANRSGLFTDEWGKKVASQRYDGKSESKIHAKMDWKTEETPQDTCDKRREPEYSNNVARNWLIGCGKGEAEGKPSFDHVGKHPKGK